MAKKTRLRTLLIGGVFTLLFVCMVGRMYWIQVVQAAELTKSAQQVWESDKEIKPVRGTIVDRNGKVLAEDAPAYTISLNPQIVNDQGIVDDVAKGLTAILKEPNNNGAELERKIRDLASKKRDDGTFYKDVEIRNEGWKIDKTKRDLILKLIDDLKPKKKRPNDSSGIYIKQENKRYYPGETLAAHVLGYMNIDGKAIQGIESKFDEALTGTPGRLATETDAKGIELPNAKVDFQPPVNGNTVKLTLDKNIQFYLENTLEKYYKEWKPKVLMGVAADPNTMEILGMANFPTFNPNEYWNTTDMAAFLNQSVSAQFEPGSTFKVVTLAATVQEGIFKEGDFFQSGVLAVPGNNVYDHNRVGWGKISFLDGLKRSSNVGFAKLGWEMLGKEKLLDYITKFGFNAKTGIDLPAEASGKVQLKWDSDYARATFGQSLSVTAIQQLAVYAAMANGGKLMWPHVVKELSNPDTGQVVQSFEPKVVSQIVTEQTAKRVTDLLEQTVDDPVKPTIGTGVNARVPGYKVAGKTGTANLVIDGKYSTEVWLTSFCGYAPADNPKIVACIVADEPDLGGNYHRGGEVAPKAFSEFMEQVLQNMGVSSSDDKATRSDPVPQVRAKVPDLSGKTADEAKTLAAEADFQLEFYGKGGKIVAQFPSAGTEIGPSQRVYVAYQSPNTLEIPDLTGRSLREALEMCAFMGITCKTDGEGFVASQRMEDDGDVQTLMLELLPPEALANDPPKKTETGAANKTAGKQGAGPTPKNSSQAASSPKVSPTPKPTPKPGDQPGQTPPKGA